MNPLEFLIFVVVFGVVGVVLLTWGKQLQGYSGESADLQDKYFGKVPVLGPIIRFNRDFYKSSFYLWELRIGGYLCVGFAAILLIFILGSIFL